MSKLYLGEKSGFYQKTVFKYCSGKCWWSINTNFQNFFSDYRYEILTKAVRMPTQAGGVDRGEAGKRSHDCDSLGLDTERSSISTTSSATSSSNGRHWTSTSANKLSKVGGWQREIIQNIWGKNLFNWKVSYNETSLVWTRHFRFNIGTCSLNALYWNDDCRLLNIWSIYLFL